MKTNLLKTFLVALLLLSATITKAYDFSTGGLYYNITSYNTVEVAESPFFKYKGSVSIPSYVTFKGDSYKVTKIGDYAFLSCAITKVNIPNSVTDIGTGAFRDCTKLSGVTMPIYLTTLSDYAFQDCESLVKITIPNGVTKIGEYTFSGCEKLIDISIPNSVTYIGRGAFWKCENISAVHINSLHNWLNITFEDELEDIWGFKLKTRTNPLSYGAALYLNGKIVTDVTIPNDITVIKAFVFDGCISIKSLQINENVTKIENGAFRNCVGINKIHIPNNVNYIGDFVFADCTNLCDVSLSNGISSIGTNAFGDCISLNNITIPNNVEAIGMNAFHGCTELASITIPGSVVNVGDGAFKGCSKLKKVYIEEGAHNLFLGCHSKRQKDERGKALFEDCPLEFVYIGRNVDYDKEAYAPFDIRSQMTIIIGKKVTKPITTNMFYSENLLWVDPSYYYQRKTIINLASVSVDMSKAPIKFCTETPIIKEIKGGDFVNNFLFLQREISELIGYYGNDEFIDFPQNYNGKKYSIGSNLFCGNTAITTISIPDGVFAIGERAFSGCKNLKNIYLSNDMAYIGRGAFDDTEWLKMQPDGPIYINNILYKYKGANNNDIVITIQEGVKTIADRAFEGCTGLKGIKIPNSVTNIGDAAFAGCTGLKEVHITDLAAWCNIDFNGNSSNPLIYADNLYLNGDIVTNLVIPEGVTKIKDCAFEYCGSLTSVTIPASVTSIGVRAFNNCTGLTAVHISDLATWCNIDFGDNPLYYAGNLYLNGEKVTNLIIPNGVTKIKNYAFNGCKDLASVTIPASVTGIGEYAFNNCNSLNNLRIEDAKNILSLDNSSFKDCPLKTLYLGRNLSYYTEAKLGFSPFYNKLGLTSITIGNNVTGIGRRAFFLCTGLTSVTIGDGVTGIGDYAFSGCTSLTSITIPSNVTSIGERAFEDCNSLREITIGDNITHIGYNAFCNTAWEKSATKDLLYLNNWLIGANPAKRDKIKSVSIKKQTKGVAVSAFNNCPMLKSVKINKELQYICANAFANCPLLQPKKIKWPKDKSKINIHNTAFPKVEKETNKSINHSDYEEIESSNMTLEDLEKELSQ